MPGGDPRENRERAEELSQRTILTVFEIVLGVTPQLSSTLNTVQSFLSGVLIAFTSPLVTVARTLSGLESAAQSVDDAVEQLDVESETFENDVQQAGATFQLLGAAFATLGATLALVTAAAAVGSLSLGPAGAAFISTITAFFAVTSASLLLAGRSVSAAGQALANFQEDDHAQEEDGDSFPDASTISPLIVDLDGDGVEALPLSNGNNIFFDLDADGLAERSAFVAPDDGLLAFDRNFNGIIDDITELFGSPTQDGFAELAELDSNQDGVINANDEEFGNLRIFQDENSDGITQEGELTSLDERGIVSIDLDAEAIDEFEAGNPVLFRSSVTFTDGSTGDIDDVFFNVDQNTTINVLPQDFALRPEVEVLPELLGIGRVGLLSVEAQNNPELEQALRDLVLNSDNFTGAEFSASVESILFLWAGIEDVSPSSRGDNIDGQHLAFIEAFFDVDFVQERGTNAGLPDPGPNAGDQFEQFYQQLLDQFVSRLGVQIFSSRVALQQSEGTLSELTFESPFLSLTSFVYDEEIGEFAVGDLTIALEDVVAAIPDHADNADNALEFIDLVFSILGGAEQDIFNGDRDAFVAALSTALEPLNDLALQEFAIARATGSALLSGSMANDVIDPNDPVPITQFLVRDLDGCLLYTSPSPRDRG